MDGHRHRPTAADNAETPILWLDLVGREQSGRRWFGSVTDEERLVGHAASRRAGSGPVYTVAVGLFFIN